MKENYYHNSIKHVDNWEATLSELVQEINQFISKEVASLIVQECKNIKEVYQPILYSLLNGGKRIRPIIFLLISGYDKNLNLNDKEKKEYLYTATSIEFIHTYSLIHDDLPAMDNDDLRRGLPTCHKKYPEWAAILAGDSLNTLAFYLLTLTYNQIHKKIKILSQYGGISGMILGQALDLSNEKKDYNDFTTDFISYKDVFQKKGYYRLFENYIKTIDDNKFYHLLMIHYHKTAALFRATVELGIITGQIDQLPEFNEFIYNSYIEYGEVLGLLFQITDDVLDETGNEDLVGKKIRKDKSLGKLTFPDLIGLEESMLLSKNLAEYCSELISNFLIPYTGKDYKNILKQLTYYLVSRKH
ncbi:MAG: geranylgeranyl pyrophosphate synthase [Leptospiraceae bacterium]|nr:MAG: geranylgeranyl pyrophosphate synthase [Leptospiraceae bacterium]